MRHLHDTRPVARLASEQIGLIRVDQLHTFGFDGDAIDNLVQIGFLHRMYTGVYAVGHTSITQSSRYLGAAWALGEDARVAHHSAAAHFGLARHGGLIHVVVPSYNGHPHRNDIRVHRQRLRREETTVHRGVPITTVGRTVMDVAASAPRLLPSVFEEAQVRYRLQPAVLAAALVTRPNHRGTGRLRRMLDGAVDPGQVQSILELRFLALCAAFGLPRPLTQVTFGRYRVDFWFKEQRVVMETDGARWHATEAKRRRDTRKDEHLRGRGQIVLHARWTDVVDQPAAVAAEVRRALQRGSSVV